MSKSRKSNAIKRLQAALQTAVTTGQMDAKGLAKKTGLPLSYVYKLLREDVEGMTVATVERVCAAIGISPASLFDASPKAPDSVIQMHDAIGRYLRGK